MSPSFDRWLFLTCFLLLLILHCRIHIYWSCCLIKRFTANELPVRHPCCQCCLCVICCWCYRLGYIVISIIDFLSCSLSLFLLFLVALRILLLLNHLSIALSLLVYNIVVVIADCWEFDVGCQCNNVRRFSGAVL